MSEPVKLRGHHLLCMLGYIGKGYTPEFIENFDHVTQQLNDGAAILLVEGPDELCSALHDSNGPVCEHGLHCLQDSVRQRDHKALQAVGSALGRALTPGASLRLESADYARLRILFAEGSLRAACEGCEWHGICDDIAAGGFQDVKLAPR